MTTERGADTGAKAGVSRGSQSTSKSGAGSAAKGAAAGAQKKAAATSPIRTSTTSDKTKAPSTRTGSTGSSGSSTGDKPSASERFAAAVAIAKNAASSNPTISSPASQPPRKVRKARLRLTHIDPWSVMKTSFLLSIALGIVTVVAVAVIWSVLGAAGVWESIDSAVSDVVGGTGASFAIEDYLGTSRVLGFTMLIAVVDVVLVTVVATLGAFLYNLAAALLGGLEVTLAEDA